MCFDFVERKVFFGVVVNLIIIYFAVLLFRRKEKWLNHIEVDVLAHNRYVLAW